MPGMMDTVLNLGLNDATVEGLAHGFGRRALRLGSATAASSRCIPTWCSGSITTGSRMRSKSPRKTTASTTMSRWTAEHWQALVERIQGHRRRGARPRVPAGRPRTAVGRDRRGVRQLGFASAPRSIAGSTASPATGAPRSTSRRWCSATWATPRPPASPSPAIRRPARRPGTANGWSTPRARTSSPASAPRNT